MASRNEIVLFFVEDKAQEIKAALPFSEAVKKQITDAQMFRLCVQSIRQRMPDSRITLITDGATQIHEGCDDVTVIRDTAITMSTLITGRVRVSRDYLARCVRESDAGTVIFMDTDILVNLDLMDAFREDFDVGFTVSFDPSLAYSERGIPINSQKTPVNGGVMFARANQAALDFYTAWVENIHTQKDSDDFAEYGTYAEDVKKFYYQWWGAQHVLQLMLGRGIKAGRTTMESAGARVRLFERDIYNFSPRYQAGKTGSLSIDITPQDFKMRYVFHMKGPRKVLMQNLAEAMKAVPATS